MPERFYHHETSFRNIKGLKGQIFLQFEKCGELLHVCRRLVIVSWRGKAAHTWFPLHSRYEAAHTGTYLAFIQTPMICFLLHTLAL